MDFLSNNSQPLIDSTWKLMFTSRTIPTPQAQYLIPHIVASIVLIMYKSSHLANSYCAMRYF